MPQVPYNPTPSVTNTDAPSDYQNIQATPNAFGAQIGGAIAGVGKTMAQGADELGSAAVQVQQLQNAAYANDLDVRAMVEIGQKTEALKQLQGKAAIDAKPQFDKDVTDIRTKYLAAAQNAGVARTLDQLLTRRVGYALVDSSSYAGQQAKVYFNQSNKAKQELGAQQALAADDLSGVQRGLSGMVDDIKHAGEVNNEAPEATQVKIQDAKDKVIGGWISAKSVSDPAFARQVLEDNKGQLSPDVYNAALKTVTQSALSVDARNIANRAISGGPGGDIGGPLAFVHHELTETMKSAGDALKQTDTVEGATDTVLRKFEVPANPDATYGARLAIAKRVFAGQGSEKEQQAANYFMTQGWTKAQSAGLVGNLSFESGGLNSNAVAKDDGGPGDDSVSIAQWHGTRKAQLQEFLKNYSPSPGVNAQGGVTQAIVAANKEIDAKYDEDPALASQLKTQVANLIRAHQNASVAADEADDKATLRTVQAAMWPAQGQAPTSIGELRAAHPELAPMIDNLSGTRRKQVEEGLAFNANGGADANVETPERVANYQRLSGEANIDPEGFSKKMILNEDLTKSQKNALIQKQVKPQKEDIKLGAALTLLDRTGVLEAAGVEKSDKENYHLFVGKLEQGMERWAQLNPGKTMSEADMKAIGQGVVADTQVPGRLWGTRTVPAYQNPNYNPDDTAMRTIPPSILNQINQAWAKSNPPGSKPNPKWVMDVYRHNKAIGKF